MNALVGTYLGLVAVYGLVDLLGLFGSRDVRIRYRERPAGTVSASLPDRF